MKKEDFKTYICEPFCTFYRQGEKEEMACHGAVIAQRLVVNQKISPADAVDKTPWEKDTDFNDDDMIRMVCTHCPFEAHDCDFRSGSPPKNTVPCGGYILLYLLKSNGLISINELREVCVGER